MPCQAALQLHDTIGEISTQYARRIRALSRSAHVAAVQKIPTWVSANRSRRVCHVCSSVGQVITWGWGTDLASGEKRAYLFVPRWTTGPVQPGPAG